MGSVSCHNHDSNSRSLSIIFPKKQQKKGIPKGLVLECLRFFGGAGKYYLLFLLMQDMMGYKSSDYRIESFSLFTNKNKVFK